MKSLTKRRLQAIQEALSIRLAGPIEDVEPLKTEDYMAALDWAIEQQQRRHLARLKKGNA